MELYTLDPANSYRQSMLVETYESVIWTDRYADVGDFEAVVEPSPEMISRLKMGVMIGMDQSPSVMIIDKSENSLDDEGKRTLKISGKSLEQILQDRPAKIDMTKQPWDLTGSPGAIVAAMVKRICVDGTGISVSDIIPGLTTANLGPTTPSTSVSIKDGTLYERIKELCDANDLGFRLRLVAPNASAFKFDVYAGVDKTGTLGVEFSNDLDNLSGVTRLVSREGFKNVAYVFSDHGTQIVTAAGFSGVTGFNRRVIRVDATDITTGASTQLDAALIQRGKDALADAKQQSLMDGEISSEYPYKYNTDYSLGDLVPMIDDDGTRQVVRVTEYIWSYDTEGSKAYPTLSAVGGV